MITVQELLDLLYSMRTLHEENEPVDQLSHALQCAGQAMAKGATDDLVIAAAFHDIGCADAVRAQYPGMRHEEAGYHFLREHFSEHIAWLVGAHVDAMRYLVAVDPDYERSLSGSSMMLLSLSGGPLDGHRLEKFASHPWCPEALVLREWDEAAKDPQATPPALADLAPVIQRTLQR